MTTQTSTDSAVAAVYHALFEVAENGSWYRYKTSPDPPLERITAELAPFLIARRDTARGIIADALFSLGDREDWDMGEATNQIIAALAGEERP